MVGPRGTVPGVNSAAAVLLGGSPRAAMSTDGQAGHADTHTHTRARPVSVQHVVRRSFFSWPSKQCVFGASDGGSQHRTGADLAMDAASNHHDRRCPAMVLV